MKTSKNVRKLTVLYRPQPRNRGKHYVFYPDLRMGGKWLAQAGFNTGQVVTVQCFKDMLIIKPFNPPAEQVLDAQNPPSEQAPQTRATTA